MSTCSVYFAGLNIVRTFDSRQPKSSCHDIGLRLCWARLSAVSVGSTHSEYVQMNILKTYCRFCHEADKWR